MDKEQLLLYIREQVKQTEHKVSITGRGNNRHVIFRHIDGRACEVWYPVEKRFLNIEQYELKAAAKYLLAIAIPSGSFHGE